MTIQFDSGCATMSTSFTAVSHTARSGSEASAPSGFSSSGGGQQAGEIGNSTTVTSDRAVYRDSAEATKNTGNTNVNNGASSVSRKKAPKTHQRNSSFFLNSSPSRSHLKYWNRTKSAAMSGSNSGAELSLSDRLMDPAAEPTPRISRQQFEDLPQNDQQQYFSEVERLRLVQHFGVAQLPTTSIPLLDNFRPPRPRRSSTGKAVTSKKTKSRPRPTHRSTIATEPCAFSSRRQPDFTAADIKFYSGLPDKIKRRHLTEDEQLLTIRPHSVVPGAIDAASAQYQSRRVRQRARIMATYSADGTHGGDSSPFYDSFRWMDENDGLDLRLGFDNFDHLQGEEATMTKQDTFGKRGSFRRHLPANKRSFSHSSTATISRPGTKDTGTSASLQSAVPAPAPVKQSVHVRRKSKALSLISLNRQTPSEPPSTFDPAAAHYRDPGTRMALREYLASPQKFDEMLEYGFPSLGEVDEDEAENSKDGQQTFLDDGRSSTNSTLSDPDSPKTPPIMDKPLSSPASRAYSESVVSSQHTCRPVAPSREMTMRITLTRPDLRSNEDQIYGWRSNVTSRKSSSAREDPSEITVPVKEMYLNGSMEDRFAAFDKEDDDHDKNDNTSGIKRFWRRVRRS